MVSVTVMAVTAWGGMLLCWPWALEAPITHPWQAFRHFTTMPMDLIVPFWGHTVRTTDLPWYYIPGFIAVRAPEIMGLLLVPAPVLALRRWRKVNVAWAVFLTALLFPPFYIIVTHKVIYDGIRHLLFLWPLLAIAAAAVLDHLIGHWPRTWRKPALGGLVLYALFHVGLLVAYHPYQSIYFNALAGGLAGAEGRFETDIWAAAVKEAITTLTARIKATEGPSALQKEYRIYVCLPYRDTTVIMPGVWKDSDDWENADFVVAPVRFPCPDSVTPWPVLGRVERFGVSLATIVDRRAPVSPEAP